MNTEETGKDALDLIEERRAQRKAELAKKYREQRAIDLEAIDAIEVELGDNCVRIVDVEFSPGLPTCLAVKTPSKPAIKRYQSRIKGAAQNKEIDAPAAAEELGSVCIVYPQDETMRSALLEARPGALTTCGTEALKLSQGRAETEGKG